MEENRVFHLADSSFGLDYKECQCSSLHYMKKSCRICEGGLLKCHVHEVVVVVGTLNKTP